MNIFTKEEHDKHDCDMKCPKYVPGTFPEHGEAIQCPHGQWFVAKVSRRPVYGGQMAEWKKANPLELKRIKKALKEERR